MGLAGEPPGRYTMDFIYDLPNWLFFLLCASLTVLFSVTGSWLVRPWAQAHALAKSDDFSEHNDLVSYFLGASGVVYGILLGLVAAGVWSNYQDVSNEVDDEATITAALYQDLATYPSVERKAFQDELKLYTRRVIDTDWPAHRQGVISQASSHVLRSFKRHITDYNPPDKRMELMHSQVVSQLNDLLRAHRLRLRGSQATLPPLLWWVLILGAVITIVISWFLVSQRIAVQLILSALIGLLLGSLLFLTAAMDNPFRGEFSVDADAFDSVLNEMIKY